MKFRIRSAKKGDEEQLKKVSEAFHLCNLPKDISEIQKKIQQSEQSFSGTLPFQKRGFLFVLEEVQTERLVGSSQILAYYTHQKHPYFIIDQKISSLRLHYTKSDSVQLGGLVLLPEFRRGAEKLGRQIGAIRFLYMLEEPSIWPEEIEVSLTAPLKDNNTGSEFWDAVGKKVFSLNYREISELYQKDFPGFLSQIPKSMTLDLKSLPSGARRAVEEIHPETLSLYHGLLKLGFKQTPLRHFLDGGISLIAKRTDVPFIAQGKRVLVEAGHPAHPHPWLWSQQTEGVFTGGVIEGELNGEGLFISKEPLPDDMKPSIPCSVTPFNPLLPNYTDRS
ncbi:MAG: arginine N-succinyltransferase [Bdellovibrionales bacterium]|nr:arginine N-succinyltransferase [Bdellovibrionales bacterium]